jgi:hypothetical protein
MQIGETCIETLLVNMVLAKKLFTIYKGDFQEGSQFK